MRKLMHNPDQWFQLLGMLNTYYWDPNVQVTARQVRHLHSNPSNWSLIPYMPKRFRDPSKSKWGAQLMHQLQKSGKMEVYRNRCRCSICGLR
jgi:hypothetical protein